jgi:vitamin K-dependent gamma-carboxylase
MVQVLLPLRHRLYPGDVLWTEDGFRYAWKVMLVEKTGSAEFTAVDRATGQRLPVRNRDHLTPLQEKAMAAQPDLFLAFAHHIERTYRAQGRAVAVYADAFVSLNGRSPTRLVPCVG